MVGEPGAEAGDGGGGDVRVADCIDDIDVVRSGGMKALFDGVYAPSTIGKLLRESTFGHAGQLESVLSGGDVLLRQAGRKFLSWLPDPVDSAVRQLDSTKVKSFMASYCQDRNISSAKATVFFTEGGLAMRTNHAEQPWALSSRNLCGVPQFVQGSGASGEYACRCYTEGGSARGAVNSVDAGGPISHE